MLISDLTVSIIIAIVSTALAAAIGAFLLQRQRRLKESPFIDTAFLKYIGPQKEQGALPTWISLYSSPLRVGRYDNFEIPLDDIRVSKFHALIVFDFTSNHFLIRDQKSTSGTFINNRELSLNEVMELRQGDTIAFGSVLYEFFDDVKRDAPPSEPTEPSTPGDKIQYGGDDNDIAEPPSHLQPNE